MYILAILENEKITFHQPLRLKQGRIEVGIVIPDEAILDDLNYSQIPINKVVKFKHPTSIRQQLDKILGKYAYKRSAATITQDKAAWHQHLECSHIGDSDQNDTDQFE